ncbi:bifunctional phosphoribosyl-AMP cyclohydrolase/phosphoribosyl-ATP diphosphatase HisIE [Thermincola potens]|uniref:Histidine biosynthesis bifunctional protein HisIE n=1 Tax=Thermincola potens (strain JR) TaxID=635013 RepID=D5XD61_THEPJ|nr:bifunctional phosphoribosyl-AMP cyclohydrolase/phosphoribosyl-ATP diphosphatase HisIE [Thermincola potens]ADG81709.1 phosphoribosyl-ATP diphosphatase [Thermincola potens JR]
MSCEVNNLKFNADGLIPAIVQDVRSKEVLMLAYMNAESLHKTLETGETWFYSRSRQELWHKGATSGNIQKVKEVFYDCDADALLVMVEQQGVACHTGEKTCFHNRVDGIKENQDVQGNCSQVRNQTTDRTPAGAEILYEVYDVIADRYVERPEGSYTTYLFNKGLDKILKKVGEEAAEVIIGAKNRNKAEVVYEVADLLYHLLVLLKEQDIKPDDVFAELGKRR